MWRFCIWHVPILRTDNLAYWDRLLVWGPAAPWLITGHEHTRYSCGQGSPFEKLVHLQAKALMFDVSLGSMTFSHYLEDQHQDTLPVKLYENIPMESIVIDTSGNTTVVQTYVFSSAARRYRNSRNLRETLIKNKMINSQKIGNTKLIVLQLQQVVECVQQMVRAGKPLWEI
jgi:aminoglycoside N3'-acetyltransferase